RRRRPRSRALRRRAGPRTVLPPLSLRSPGSLRSVPAHDLGTNAGGDVRRFGRAPVASDGRLHRARLHAAAGLRPRSARRTPPRSGRGAPPHVAPRRRPPRRRLLPITPPPTIESPSAPPPTLRPQTSQPRLSLHPLQPALPNSKPRLPLHPHSPTPNRDSRSNPHSPTPTRDSHSPPPPRSNPHPPFPPSPAP